MQQSDLVFTGSSTAIFCATEEEAQQVTQIADNAGLIRKDGKHWYEFQTPGGFAYALAEGSFGAKENFIFRGFEIIQASEFIFRNTPAE